MSLTSQLNALVTRIAEEIKNKVNLTDPRLTDNRTPTDGTVSYAKVSNTLKSRGSVSSMVDLSTNGIGAIILSSNTSFGFTGFQINKSYLLIITTNGFTPSWATAARHIPVEGNANFSSSGVYYVCLTCIDATPGSEKLLTTIMKGS